MNKIDKLLAEQTPRIETLMYQKDFADMVREEKLERYSEISLLIASESLKIASWGLLLTLMTFLISLTSLLLTSDFSLDTYLNK